MIDIIYSSKNFVVLKYDESYFCFSYGKLIAEKSDIFLTTHNSKIETQKNKCHLKQFKDIMEELEQNNTP